MPCRYRLRTHWDRNLLNLNLGSSTTAGNSNSSGFEHCEQHHEQQLQQVQYLKEDA